MDNQYAGEASIVSKIKDNRRWSLSNQTVFNTQCGGPDLYIFGAIVERLRFWPKDTERETDLFSIFLSLSMH